MRIELKPRKKDTTPELTPEQIAALEKEKAELLAGLASPRRRPAPVEPEHLEKLVEVEVPDVDAQPEVLPVRQGQALQDVAAATTERKQLEADLKNLETQIAAARLREKQAQQAAVIASQQQAQAQGSKQLAPLKPRLEKHLADVSRLQARYGPALREMARSLATGADAQIRRAKADAYRAAAPLGARLGEARSVVESALRGLGLAMQSAQPHVHVQASTLSEVALGINLVSLETDCASLVELVHELNPTFTVSNLTADRTLPSSLEPRTLTPSADFGPSII